MKQAMVEAIRSRFKIIEIKDRSFQKLWFDGAKDLRKENYDYTVPLTEESTDIGNIVLGKRQKT